MKKYLLTLLAASLAIGLQSGQSAWAASHKAKTSTQKPASPDVTLDDDQEPDTSAASPTEFHCELGNKLTVYRNADDDNHITLRWKTRLHRMNRVDTQTGADRFENRKYGLVWIGIPAKSMLLDSKKGQQLANECKRVQQDSPPQS